MFQGVQQKVPGRQTGSFHGPRRSHPEETRNTGHELRQQQLGQKQNTPQIKNRCQQVMKVLEQMVDAHYETVTRL